MVLPYYTGRPRQAPAQAPAPLPLSRRAVQNNPAGYMADKGLVDAVNVALLLGQPLLLTGEPGTGKTQLASSVAWELGYGAPLVFETKSTSSARDLFYIYDTLGRFHSAQTREGSQRSLDYITFNALGLAILRSNEESAVRHLLSEDFVHDGPQRSVVLIDEVDKSPRDFPNDLLNEVEGMYFKIPELGNVKVSAREEMRPVLIITSNSEKHLPDAFLRRCTYYNIPFPEKLRLAQIVMTRVSGFPSSRGTLLSDALDFFSKLREPGSGLRKRPATAELLGWLVALRESGAHPDQSLREISEITSSTLSALVKSADDQTSAKAILDDWLKYSAQN